MKQLETTLQISEEELKRSRKDFHITGMFLHFAGELVGPLYSMIGGVFIPLSHGKIDYKNFLIGLGIYVSTQVPSFLLKGLSMTKEDNFRLAKKFKEDSEENRKKGYDVLAWLDKKIGEMHYHFANHSERYDKWVYNYTKIKRKLFSNTSLLKSQNPKNI